MKEYPLLSVIVPVYQAEAYLNRCVDSLIKQTYTNLEIILVNDGSQDNSPMLCDQLAEFDERIKVIHKSNGGLSSARNAGLEVATGDYVTFIDSDDWISLSIYEDALKATAEYQADIVDFQVQFVKNEEEASTLNNVSPVAVDDDEILLDYLYRGQTEICPFSVCRKVYHRQLFTDVRFPVGKVNEDISTNFKVLQKANRLVHLERIGYYYYQGNESSLTSGQLRQRDFDLLDASQELIDLSEKYPNQEILKLAQIKLARSYFSLLAKAAVGGVSEDVSKEAIADLTTSLRKSYLLLMQSPMPLNRKLLATLFAIDYRVLAYPFSLYKRLRK